MDDEMPALANKHCRSSSEGENFCLDGGGCFSTDNILYSLSLYSEHLVLDQAAVVCCLALVTCMNVR